MNDDVPERTYELSRHARNRLRQYRGGRHQLDVPHIIDVVERPDAVTPTEKERWNAWKRIDDYWLRVTYRTEADRVVVITVTVKSSGPRNTEAPG